MQVQLPPEAGPPALLSSRTAPALGSLPAGGMATHQRSIPTVGRTACTSRPTMICAATSQMAGAHLCVFTPAKDESCWSF